MGSSNSTSRSSPPPAPPPPPSNSPAAPSSDATPRGSLARTLPRFDVAPAGFPPPLAFAYDLDATRRDASAAGGSARPVVARAPTPTPPPAAVAVAATAARRRRERRSISAAGGFRRGEARRGGGGRRVWVLEVGPGVVEWTFAWRFVMGQRFGPCLNRFPLPCLSLSIFFKE